MREERARTVILVSGSGTNLQAFIDAADAGEANLDIVLVIGNRPDAYGLTRARDAGIETACVEHGNFKDRESFDREIAGIIDRYDADLIILAGFMRILSPWFVRHFEGQVLNIHPALLPAYPGLDTHQRVLDAGESRHGSTVHFVTEELDGGPRIIQGRIAVDPDESAEELASRVQAVEHRIYPQAADWFASGRLQYRHHAAWLDGAELGEPVVIDFDED